LLKDETIRAGAGAGAWLTKQPVSSITLQNFTHALNTQILLLLDVSLKSHFVKGQHNVGSFS
jgi:hypothetical protein